MRKILRRWLVNPSPTTRIVLLLSAVVSYGTTGFLYFELPARPDLKPLDGLWWSLVTITTIGYGDYFPTTSGGRFVIAVPLMLFGIGLLGFVLSVSASKLVEARNMELFGMAKSKLEGHLVIVNYPSLAKVERVVDELRSDPDFEVGDEILLIDEDLEALPASLVKRGVGFVRGSPSRDETLERANIDSARYAVILTQRPGDARSDHQALAVCLAIEGRNPNVRTTVEVVDVVSEELLRKAGVDRVVCTSRFDAHFISNEVIHPGVQEVLDQLLSHLAGRQQLYLTPFGSGTYGAVAERCRSKGHTAIGLQRAGKTRFNPPNDLDLAPGDLLVSIGERKLDPV
ncbi:MAG: potassium channel protein [Myxococcales bacterium]|nr:potassium channel protein [Myxococcales bacterium]